MPSQRDQTADTSDGATQFSASQNGAAARDAIAERLCAYGPYLLLIAEHELNASLRRKVGASDPVQETLLKAHQGFAGFQGSDEESLKRWLRRILLNCVADEIQKFYATPKRRLRRELPLDNDSKWQLRNLLVSPDSSPSEELMAQEQAESLLQAIEQLPNLYRRVILLRNRECLQFSAIGKQLKRTPDAARLLWYRALLRLEGELKEDRR